MIRKRVLIYIKDPKGGTGTFILNLSRLLATNNYDLLCVAHNSYFDQGLINNKKIGFWINKQKGFSLLNILYSFINFLFLVKEIFIYRPSFIYSVDLYANISSILAKLIFFPSVKLISSTHINLHKHISNGRNVFFSKFLIDLIKLLYPYSSIHIVPSYELAANLRKIINSKFFFIKTIHYFLDRKKVILQAREIGTNKPHTLTTFTRLDSQKNIDLLIKSVIFLNSKKNKIINLQILGSGDIETELKNKYTSYNYIDFVGWKRNPFPYLLNSQIFILISKYEGFPYSIIEAMTLGKPVIASDVDYGPREIIGKNKYGLLTNNTLIEISTGILKMLEKKNLIKFQKLSILRSADFDREKLKNKYLSLFKI